MIMVKVTLFLYFRVIFTYQIRDNILFYDWMCDKNG